MEKQLLMFRASPTFLEAAQDKTMPEFSMTAYTGLGDARSRRT